MVKITEKDMKKLQKLVKGIELTLEITDLYITTEMLNDLKLIMIKLVKE